MLVASPTHAGDGSVRWRTLHTADADIVAPEHLSAFAERVADVIGDARKHLSPLFNERPRPKLQLSMDDFADSANGWAAPLPYDHLHILAYPPDPSNDLGDHGDWVRALVFHEYAHILHMGDVSGLPALGNALFGRRFLPNAVLPRMMLEGLATWVETRYTGSERSVAGAGGRVDSAQYSAMLRAAVRDGTLPRDVDELGGAMLRWPFGNAWYLYGSLLMDDIARRFGDAKMREFMGRTGARLVASGLNSIARKVFGASVGRLWRDACDRVRRDALDEWQRAAGLPAEALAADTTGSLLADAERHGDGTRLTRDGNWRGQIRLDPSGRDALVAHTPVDGLPRIERIALQDGSTTTLHVCAYDCDEPQLTPDGAWLLMVAARNRARVYLYRELVAVPLRAQVSASLLGADGELQLTDGLRGRSVSISPDGQRVFGVAVRGARTALFALDLAKALRLAAAGTPIQEADWTWLTGPAALGTVLDSPVQVGDELWWTWGRGGERRAVRAALLGPQPRLGSAAQVPGFVPEGDLLLPKVRPVGPEPVKWVSDLQVFRRGGRVHVGGLAQIGHRRDAAEFDPLHPEKGWRLRSRTMTGLASAAIGDTTAATVRHQGGGLDVWLAPAVPLPAPSTPTAAIVAQEIPASYTPPTAPGQRVWSGYNPLSSIAPRAWAPILLTAGDGADWRFGGTWLGAQVTGQDAAGFADLRVQGQMRNNATDRFLSLEVNVHRWEPTWTLALTYDEPWSRFRRGFWWYATPERRVGGRIGVAYHLPHLRSAWDVSLGVRWIQTWLVHDNYDLAVTADPGGPIPREPGAGTELVADWSLGWGRAERYALSIRPERLRSWSVRALVGDSLTTGLQRVVIGADVGLAWPLGHRWVLSGQAHASLAPLPGQTRALYSISGIYPLQGLAVLGLGGPTGWTIRGAPVETGLGGNALAWGGADLSFPLLDIGKTVELLPFYAGRLTGSLFVDAAVAGWPVSGTRAAALASIGGELAVDLQVAYTLDAVLRCGWAWVPQLQSSGGWLSLGL